MLLLKRTFRRADSGFGCLIRSGKGARIDLCKEGFFYVLQKHFDLPDDASPVTVSLHSHPAKDRQEFKVIRKIDCDGDCYPALKAKGSRATPYSDLNDILRPLIGKTVYMAVEYEEA